MFDMDFLYEEEEQEEEEVADILPFGDITASMDNIMEEVKQETNLTYQFFEKGGFKFLSELEQNYTDCASVCEPPLFYVTKGIDLGVPT